MIAGMLRLAYWLDQRFSRQRVLAVFGLCVTAVLVRLTAASGLTTVPRWEILYFAMLWEISVWINEWQESKKTHPEVQNYVMTFSGKAAESSSLVFFLLLCGGLLQFGE
jgi:hypothetical protein